MIDMYCSQRTKLAAMVVNTVDAINEPVLAARSTNLLIEKPEAGGAFEYVKDVRDADAGEMGFTESAEILDGIVTPTQLAMQPGSLVLFRGRNSMHRVTPTIGGTTRMLVVLAYNTEPGVSLSESARMTFFGRLA